MKRVACLLAVLFVAAASLPATAQQRCTNRPDIVRHLAQKLSELPVAIGMSVSGGIVEFLSSQDGRSWTIISTMPNGNFCLIAVGKNRENIDTIAKLGPGV